MTESDQCPATYLPYGQWTPVGCDGSAKEHGKWDAVHAGTDSQGTRHTWNDLDYGSGTRARL